MTIISRAAGGHDLSDLYDMARTTGGGFVNLPPDREKLGERLADAASARDTDSFGVDRFLLVLEDSASAAIHGTCQIFSHIGTDTPFYSYRIDRHGADHAVLGRSVDHTMLTICTDHAGCSEVGGLFLRADARAGGADTLLARSRYLFIAMLRARSADRTIAELRGVVDDADEAPFWDGIAARFFGMGFTQANAFNADRGAHVLAGLLPESGRAVLGVPHPSGRPALRLLEKEGFRYDNYIDLFDGGPTVTAATDDIATIRNARTATVRAVAEDADATPHIAAAGRLADFRACFAAVARQDDGITIDPEAARALGVRMCDPITFAPR